MPRSGRKWAAGLVLALVASGAGAQLVRKPANVLPQLAVPVPLLKPGDSLTKPILPQARVPLRTVRTTLDSARLPRLSSTIERSSNLVLSVVGSPLQLKQPLISNAQA